MELIVLGVQGLQSWHCLHDPIRINMLHKRSNVRTLPKRQQFVAECLFAYVRSSSVSLLLEISSTRRLENWLRKRNGAATFGRFSKLSSLFFCSRTTSGTGTLDGVFTVLTCLRIIIPQ